MTRALSATILLALLGLAACNTVEGAGQDVKAAGQGVTNASSAVKNGS